MREMLVLLIILFLISGIYAQCNETQININTASAENLDDLYGIGPVKAEEIIKARLFESVDDLIRVYGIGNITLNKIKEQGLACVEQTINKTIPSEKTEEKQKSQDIEEETFLQASETEADKPKEPITFNTINLNPSNPKTIKSSNGEEKSENIGNYAIYGFTAFCILIAVLFMLKIRRRKLSEFK